MKVKYAEFGGRRQLQSLTKLTRDKKKRIEFLPNSSKTLPQNLIQRQNHQHLRPNKNTNHAIAQLPPCPGLSETFTSNHWQLRLLKWLPKCFSTSVAMYWANSSAVVWTMGSKTQSSAGSTNFTLAQQKREVKPTLAAEFSIHHLPFSDFIARKMKAIWGHAGELDSLNGYMICKLSSSFCKLLQSPTALQSPTKGWRKKAAMLCASCNGEASRPSHSTLTLHL